MLQGCANAQLHPKTQPHCSLPSRCRASLSGEAPLQALIVLLEAVALPKIARVSHQRSLSPAQLVEAGRPPPDVETTLFELISAL